MSWAAAAAVGSAVVGGVVSSRNASKAAKASQGGADAAAQVQWDMYDRSRDDLAPWRATGNNALKMLAQLTGVDYAETTEKPGEISAENFDEDAYLAANPDVANSRNWEGKTAWDHYNMYGRDEGRQFQYINPPGSGESASTGTAGKPDYSAFFNSPDYQFAYDEGQRATNAGLAARGLSGSGRAMKELTRYGQGMASQQLNTYLNRLSAMAGVGQTATTNTAQLGANTANQVAAAQQNAGDARASGYLGQGNAVNQGINNAFGTYAMMNIMKGV